MVEAQPTIGTAPALPFAQGCQSGIGHRVAAPAGAQLDPSPIVRTPMACDLGVPQAGGLTMGGEIHLALMGNRRANTRRESRRGQYRSYTHPAEALGCRLRAQFPRFASVGRCDPPGVSAVQTGQHVRLPAPYPVPCWLQRISLLRWVSLTMAWHTFACAVHRCLLDGIPGSRLPGSAVEPRFRPLRTSRGPGGYACTPAPGGKGLPPHGELRDKARGFAIFPRTEVLFRPTGRTYAGAE
jgi:hypothetical protein